MTTQYSPFENKSEKSWRFGGKASIYIQKKVSGDFPSTIQERDVLLVDLRR